MTTAICAWQCQPDPFSANKGEMRQSYNGTNRTQAQLSLHSTNFRQSPVYPAVMFHRWFRMHIQLFEKILQDMVYFNEYFFQKYDTAGQWGFSTHPRMDWHVKDHGLQRKCRHTGWIYAHDLARFWVHHTCCKLMGFDLEFFLVWAPLLNVPRDSSKP